MMLMLRMLMTLLVDCCFNGSIISDCFVVSLSLVALAM